jgi:hypothetical protein
MSGNVGSQGRIPYAIKRDMSQLRIGRGRAGPRVTWSDGSFEMLRQKDALPDKLQ